MLAFRLILKVLAIGALITGAKIRALFACSIAGTVLFVAFGLFAGTRFQLLIGTTAILLQFLPNTKQLILKFDTIGTANSKDALIISGCKAITVLFTLLGTYTRVHYFVF